MGGRMKDRLTPETRLTVFIALNKVLWHHFLVAVCQTEENNFIMLPLARSNTTGTTKILPLNYVKNIYINFLVIQTINYQYFRLLITVNFNLTKEYEVQWLITIFSKSSIGEWQTEMFTLKTLIYIYIYIYITIFNGMMTIGYTKKINK